MKTLILSAERMRNYLPEYWSEYDEMLEILKSQGIEIDNLTDEKDLILTDAFILTMTESRIIEWERWLKLPSTGTLEERRYRILSYFSVISKLTKESIQTLVASLYDGARADVTFGDSTIKIVIRPLQSHEMDDLDLTKLYNQLYTRKPCHIALTNERYQNTWNDIKMRFISWQAVKDTNINWDNVKLSVPN